MYNFLKPFDFVDDFFGNFNYNFPVSYPNKDKMTENEKEYTLAITIPGFDKKDIELFVENDVLKLVAENKDRKYSRSYSLPDIRDEDITAKLENGILIVSIPKREVIKKVIKIA